MPGETTIDMRDVVIRYVVHPNTGKGLGCVVAVKTDDGIKIGWSQCNPRDVFNRKVARSIAIQRAINPPVKTENGEPVLKPASVKFRMYSRQVSPFEPTRSKVVTVTNPLESVIQQVESIAKKAFAPKVAVVLAEAGVTTAPTSGPVTAEEEAMLRAHFMGEE